ncbi:site-specific integrase [Runella aurantiaca]|uniref:Site-specific integrase n=1 Tax=Runella aurantiaca TaxID=2282308 RepID=A0A369IHX9_9BACT|nr:site-specific integrase [Runella aurantiaca]RDB07785.1 site-specific integrase [Runella aurantiaca]
MAKINFYLRDKEADSPTPILMFISYNGARLTKVMTGETIDPMFWDAKTQRAKQTKKFPTFPEFNSRLSNIETLAENLLRQYMNDNDQQPPTVETYRALLNQSLNITPKRETVKPIDLFSFMDSYLTEYETRIFEKTGRPITKTTMRVYKQAFRVLKEFKEKEYKKREFSFAQIDYHFYTQFQQYLVKQNFSTNTIGKHIRTLKTFFLEAQERGLMPNFSPKKFKSVSEPSDAIYLNESELNTLFELDLNMNPRLEKVRDLFLVGCWTGLRFSDFTRIKKENIDGEFIEMETQKTGEVVVIPIHWQVEAILKRYEGKTPNSLPKPISNQKMNDYLKELGQLAGFNETVSETMTKGGVRQTVNYPKFELITTHTARRSFATNQYLAGFPSTSIMKITGHRTEKAFMKYIKITPREHANKLRDLWRKNTPSKDEPFRIAN